MKISPLIASVLSVLLLSLAVAAGPTGTAKPPAVKKPEIGKPILKAMGFESAWKLDFEREISNLWLLFSGKKTESTLLVYSKDKRLFRVDLETGMPRWVFPVKEGILPGTKPFIYHYPIVTGLKQPESEVVFLCKDKIKVLSLDRGAQLAEHKLSFTPTSSSWASESHVYVGGPGNKVVAIPKDKRQAKAWDFTTNGKISSPGITCGNMIIFASEDGKLYNINAYKGTKNWAYDTHGAVVSAPYLFRNRVYVGSRDEWVYSISAIDSSKKWAYCCEVPVEQTSVATAGRRGRKGIVFAVSSDGVLHAIDFRRGVVKWKIRGGMKVLSRGGDKVYILNDKKEIMGVDEGSGAVQWKLDFKKVDFLPGNYNWKVQLIILGYKNGTLHAIKEKEKF